VIRNAQQAILHVDEVAFQMHGEDLTGTFPVTFCR
jgi:hypothetical protein